MTDTTMTVAELGRQLSDLLAVAFEDELWVSGEISGLSRPGRGHVYFELVEPGPLGQPPEAVMKVALFETNRRGVNALLRRSGGVRMTDGMRVRIRARVDYYPPSGRLQLIMTGIDPAYTLGRLAAERERVVGVLRDEGLLDRNRSLRLADVPLRIGLVTAQTSAAYADFTDELERSGYNWLVTLCDVQVQGRSAEQSVHDGIVAVAGHEVDAIVVIRGGGARSDLATFDAELVARAIADAPVPVLTGIGHETDSSVADLVAHTTHKTPTACAAALVGRVATFLDRLDDAGTRLAAAADRVLAGRRHDTQAASLALDGSTRVRLALASESLDRAGERAARAAPFAVERAEQRLEGHHHRLRALDPARTMARGWSITRRPDGSIARSATDLSPGDRLLTSLADGEAQSTVDRVRTLEEVSDT